jgi:cytochrome c-type biogenesis protein CcmF
VAWAFVTSDFSLHLVTKNSHSSKPFLYKISGVWANHEGSMLLWVWVHGFMGAFFAFVNRHVKNSFVSDVLGFHGLLSIAFLGFLLLTSNPFERLWPPPSDGFGLNPVLQDPALAFHPPFLYFGYVGFSILFCISLAYLKQNELANHWIKTMRLWTLFPWSMLTIGIMLGSFWAYYELGWGGWWFWDPVENASLMPWLLASALLHLLPLAKKNYVKGSWVFLLGLCIFNLSVFGTFIVRSGFLTSVHSFALDPKRGIILFAILVGFITLSILHYVFSKNKLQQVVTSGLFSKETGLLINILILSLSTMILFFSMVYPLILDLVKSKNITLGPSFFEKSFIPLMIPFVFLLPLGPFLPWHKINLNAFKKNIIPIFILAFCVSIVVGLNFNTDHFYVFLGLFLSIWCIFGSLYYFYSQVIQRISGLVLSKMPLFLAHFGFGVALFGMVASNSWHKEEVLLLKEGQHIEFQGYYFKLKNLSEFKGPNYLSLMGEFDLLKNGQIIGHLNPERRLYPIEQKATTEIAIHTRFLSDFYLVMGEEDPLKRGWAFKLHYYPFVPLIWLGCLIIALGGLFGFLYALRRKNK